MNKDFFSQCRQSHWPSRIEPLKSRAEYTDNLWMSLWQCRNRDEFLSHSSTVNLLQKITSFYFTNPFDLSAARLILSAMIHLRYLRINYVFDYDLSDECKNEHVMNFFSDTSLCNILTSNRLQKLNVFSGSRGPNKTHMASLIVKGLPNLQSVELSSLKSDIFEILLRFLNVQSNLTFVACYTRRMNTNEQHSLLSDLQKSTTRPYRIECANAFRGETQFYLWL